MGVGGKRGNEMGGMEGGGKDKHLESSVNTPERFEQCQKHFLFSPSLLFSQELTEYD